MFTSSSTQQNGTSVFPEVYAQSKENFIFIGDFSFYSEAFRQYFYSCYKVHDLNSAKKILKGGTVIPEMIILDIPLAHLELIEFKVWLRAHDMHLIPIIYNESALNKNEIRRLFSQKIIDDVVSIENHYKKLQKKSQFLQKINDYKKVKNTSLKADVASSSGCRFCMVKRIFDFVFSLALLFLCCPLFIIIAIFIKFESKGPVFYLSDRAGKGFKIFKFYKFRTMILDAEKRITEYNGLNIYENHHNTPAFFKLQDDPRVTRVGAILRKISLDELPQLFNVLKGDMSLVGNRPLPLYEASTLTTDEWAVRFMAPAGITGLWQVSKHGKENMSNEERILLDINYARTRSLMGDFKIMLRTPAALVQKTNV